MIEVENTSVTYIYIYSNRGTNHTLGVFFSIIGKKFVKS